jgi:L-lactate utilization protein LutC
MSHDTHSYIGFEKYSEHVPPSIPLAVQQATNRFVGGRAARVAELPQWEQLRQIGSDIRQHTIENMDVYLTRLEEKVLAAGGHVHWAETAEDARRIVLQVAKENNVKNVVKSKSMATEEIELNRALEAAGIEALETDLGEYIIQLAGTGPSHIIVPAVHLKKEEIAALFSAKLDINAPNDPIELARIAREVLREKFLNAGMGISGGNFLIAETGTLVMVTNEGNGRMCTTMPDLHVAVVGIDKVIPDWDVPPRGKNFPPTPNSLRVQNVQRGSLVQKNFIWYYSIMGDPKFSKILSGGMYLNVFAAVRVPMFVPCIKMWAALPMARLSLAPSVLSFRRKCLAPKQRVNCRMHPHFAARVPMFVPSKFPSQPFCVIYAAE